MIFIRSMAQIAEPLVWLLLHDIIGALFVLSCIIQRAFFMVLVVDLAIYSKFRRLSLKFSFSSPLSFPPFDVCGS